MTDTTPPTTGPRFNLVDEPWLSATTLDGTAQEVSLLDAFHRAHELRGLTGELPTVAFAGLRLLLAVLHRAVGGPRDVEHWERLSDDWDDTVALVEQHLDRFHDRFWLVHATQPFFQVAGLEAQNGELKEPGSMIADGPGNSAFLTTRLRAGVERLSWSEAARWLVHVQAYDVSGIHAGAVGDPRVKGGKGYPIGTGWAGQLGGVHLVGDTLRQTLLLNLVAPGAGQLDFLVAPRAGEPSDTAVWERTPHGPRPEGWTERGTDQSYRTPQGPADLYTWQSRRVRLHGDESFVTGVVNAQGDRATPQFRQHLEPLTAWRYSDPQSAKFKQPVYMPLEPQPGRALWRGLGALLPHTRTEATKSGQPRWRPPAVLEWAATLQDRGLIGDGLVAVRAVGAEYVSNQTAIGATVDDTLAIPTALLRDDADHLAQLAVDAVGTAEQAVLALGYLAKNVALAAGASPDGSEGFRARATELAYAGLDAPFRAWVRTLGQVGEPGGSGRTAMQADAAWQDVVRRTVIALAEAEITAAGTAALVGRTSGGRFVDAGLAERQFRKRLAEVLPHAVDRDGGPPEPARSAPAADSTSDDDQEVA